MKKFIKYFLVFNLFLGTGIVFAASYSGNTKEIVCNSGRCFGGLLKLDTGGAASDSDFSYSDNFDSNTITTNSAGKTMFGGIISISKAATGYKNILNISNSTFDSNNINNAGVINGGLISVGGGYSNAGTTYNGFLEFNVYNSLFSNNYVEGGAINGGLLELSTGSGNAAGKSLIVNSTFSNNTINATNSARIGRGAVIFLGNGVSASLVDTSFLNNTANTANTSKNIGIVRNDFGKLNIVSKDKDVVFSGNTINGNSNSIFNESSVPHKATTNINVNSGRKVIFDDAIDGSSGVLSDININDSTNTLPTNYEVDSLGTVVFNTSISNNNINIYGGRIEIGTNGATFNNAPVTIGGASNPASVVISSQNGLIDNTDFGSLTINQGSTLNLAIDIDLANRTKDTFDASGSTSLSGTPITINNMNVIDYGDADVTVVNMAMGSLTDYINYDLPDSLESPVFTYKLTFDNTSKDLTFSRSMNKYLYNESVSMRSLASTQHDISRKILEKDSLFKFDIASEKLVLSDRIKYRSKPIKRKIFNLVRVDSETDAVRMAKGEDVYGILASLYTQKKGNESLAKSGVWFDAFGSKEDRKYDHDFPTVKDNYFSILLGLNSETKKFDNGVRAYGNVYLGYLRGNQKYTGSKVTNDGAYLGGSVVAEYNNFVLGFTGNLGFSSNDASHRFGKDSYDNYWLSLATKFGYNWVITDKYLLEPSIYLSYTFVKGDDYTSKSTVRIKQDNLNSLQLAPALKFTRMFEDAQALSLQAKYVSELVNGSKMKANTFSGLDLGEGNFLEYGISYDKIIQDKFSVNLELNRRDGDTKGWNGGVGLKFLF